VTLVNPNDADFPPARVTNRQYTRFLGALLDQLQIHPHLSSPRPQTSAQQPAAQTGRPHRSGPRRPRGAAGGRA
jgi:hypothetical protein